VVREVVGVGLIGGGVEIRGVVGGRLGLNKWSKCGRNGRSRKIGVEIRVGVEEVGM
jgi:hypothetical protein